ncbi:MAG: glycoside hydrolase family 88 protein [Filimonas sp.]|nr:glycoside hydrolase family 88 protein [Filimonas sp.]
MKKQLSKILLVASAFAASQSMAQTPAQPLAWSERAANTVMRNWTDSFTSEGRSKAQWSYDQGVILKGMEGLWYRTGKGEYYKYIDKSVNFFVNDDGTIKTYKLEDYNIDNVLNGRLLLTMFRVTDRAKFYKAASTLREQLNTQPRTNEGGFWHKKRYPSQMWLDGLYMGEPFYAEYAYLFKQDSAFNDIAKQFILMERHARDSKTGLLYHGWDESKEQQWADKTTGVSPNFWGRAMGWYGMALVDALEYFPANHPKRDTLINILKRYAVAVQKVQDAKTGLWWDILDKPNVKPNYFEASASCMFVYTFAKAVRLGYLPASYLTVAQKGYDGIIKQFVKADDNGGMTLDGTVGVSGLGGTPYRDGSFDYYMKEKIVVNDPKGLGAFLLASNEIELAAMPKIGKGKTVTLDSYFNAETKKDGAGFLRSYHYKWEEMKNEGFSIWGYAFKATGANINTLYEAPTADNLKKSDVYIIVDPDTKDESPNPNYMDEKSAQSIYDWVKNGGVLVMMMNDSINTEFKHFNTLSEKFGIHFNQDIRNRVTGTQYEMGAQLIPANDAIFKTAKKIYLKEICTIALKAPAKAHYTDKGDVLMAVAKVGKGTVFAVDDPWLYNEYTDGKRLPADFDNYKAAKDLTNWLLQQVPAKK